jgi:hypothetical protein
MKIRFFFGILLGATLVWQLGAMLTYSFNTVPGGSYLTSCRNIKMDIKGEGFQLMRVVTAECKDAQGKWKKTSVEIPVMQFSPQDATLINDNGTLAIIESRIPSYQNPMDSGAARFRGVIDQQ